MPRRLRSDSLTSQIAMAQTSQRLDVQFEWPETWDLPADAEKAERAKLIADDVWSARPPNEWSAAERNIIAELAIISADLAAIQKILSDSNYLCEAREQRRPDGCVAQSTFGPGSALEYPQAGAGAQSRLNRLSHKPTRRCGTGSGL